MFKEINTEILLDMKAEIQNYATELHEQQKHVPDYLIEQVAQIVVELWRREQHGNE